jgi:hypothetical protein
MSEPEKITIESDFHSVPDLEQILAAAFKAKAGEIDFRQEPQTSEFRVDPTLLVALTTGGFSVLTSLITAIFALLKRPEAKGGSIEISYASGTILRLPADTSPARLRRLLEENRLHPVERIALIEI